jgi:hypothetical protein
MIATLHFLVIFAITFFYFRKSGLSNPILFWLAFAIKIFMAMALGWIYLHYYAANDTWLFFKDASVLAQFAERNFSGYLNFMVTNESTSEVWSQLVNSQERSVFLIKVMSVVALITQHNYWVSAAYFSVIAFMASWYFFLVMVENFSESKVAAALAFLFFPTINFWSAGLIKETLALAGLYFIAALFVKIILRKKIYWWEVFTALICFWITWTLKYYWAALFGAVIFTSLFVFFLSRVNQFISAKREIFWLLIFVMLCGAVSLLHPNFHPERFLSVLVTNHNDFLRISKPDAVIHFYQLTETWWSIIMNSPWAFFSGILRPFVWEATGATAWIASIENMVIAVLLFSAVIFWKKPSSNKMLLLSVIVYVVLLSVFLALSTPNFGTLSRYRVGFLPFLIFVISYRNKLLMHLSNRF